MEGQYLRGRPNYGKIGIMRVRLKLGEILIKSGYGKAKVLSAIGFPRCMSISVELPPGSLDTLEDSFVVTSKNESKVVQASNSPIYIEMEPLPLLSDIDISNRVVQFFYSNRTIRRVIVKSRSSIPEAIGWSDPQIIKPEYPMI